MGLLITPPNLIFNRQLFFETDPIYRLTFYWTDFIFSFSNRNEYYMHIKESGWNPS